MSETTHHPHPLRIQRKRIKGWRMPEGAVSVTRPGRWGNPYKYLPAELSLAMFENSVQGFWNPALLDDESDEVVRRSYADHAAFTSQFGMHPIEAITELRGRQLACWCPLDRPCHADILARAANPERR